MALNAYDLDSYDFHLPEDRIAKSPAKPRDSSRLMIIDRKKESFEEIVFRDLLHVLEPKDLLLFNDTEVIPARLHLQKESAAQVELLLTEAEGKFWKAMARPAKKLRAGDKLYYKEKLICQVQESLEDGYKLLSFFEDVFDVLDQYGTTPLPHYIGKSDDEQEERALYQTVFAKKKGAVAAPTAALHFSEELLYALEQKGVQKELLTLHVGPGTFRPIKVQDLRQHQMHSEHYFLSQDFVDQFYACEGKRICVGTTTCRTLESCARDGSLKASEGRTDIFIYPGYRFQAVDHLLTNFHLPRSSLLLLVSAFAGRELIMEAYKKAILEGYRFYSYGDAMLIL